MYIHQFCFQTVTATEIMMQMKSQDGNYCQWQYYYQGSGAIWHFYYFSIKFNLSNHY